MLKLNHIKVRTQTKPGKCYFYVGNIEVAVLEMNMVGLRIGSSTFEWNYQSLKELFTGATKDYNPAEVMMEHFQPNIPLDYCCNENIQQILFDFYEKIRIKFDHPKLLLKNFLSSVKFMEMFEKRLLLTSNVNLKNYVLYNSTGNRDKKLMLLHVLQNHELIEIFDYSDLQIEALKNNLNSQTRIEFLTETFLEFNEFISDTIKFKNNFN